MSVWLGSAPVSFNHYGLDVALGNFCSKGIATYSSGSRLWQMMHPTKL